jgi:2'-5' RNA ligase
MAKHFLFLELRDNHVCFLLLRLREIFTGKQSKTNIHITVRGPYVDAPTNIEISRWTDLIKNDRLRIAGVGSFQNGDNHIVYVAVNSRNLREIWWKPDYSIKKYKFNPHISLYDGEDAELALLIKEFLENENLDIECTAFELTPYVSQSPQYSLLVNAERAYQKHFSLLVLKSKVKGDILERAQKLISDYQSVSSRKNRQNN